MSEKPPVSPPIEYSPGCILFGISNALVLRAKYLLFLKQIAYPPFETVVANALNKQLLDSAAHNLDHGQDSPSTKFILQQKNTPGNVCAFPGTTQVKGFKAKGQRIQGQSPNFPKILARRGTRTHRADPTHRRDGHSSCSATDH